MGTSGSILTVRNDLLKRSVITLVLSWCGGLLAGTLFAAGADESLLSLMRRALSCRVSIVLLFLAAVLPFLITAYAVCINKYLILYAACFLKGLVFSYCAFLIFRAMGDSGWLLQPMFQFTDSVMCTVFCWFSLRCCTIGERLLKRDLMVCIFISALVVIIDFLLVSPFLGTLVHY